jgi:hypothetical protein
MSGGQYRRRKIWVGQRQQEILPGPPGTRDFWVNGSFV